MPDTTDPYGVDLAIDGTGDLRVTHSGALGAVAGADCVSQAVLLRLRTSRGEITLHPAYGSTLPTHFVGSHRPLGAMVTELNSELLELIETDGRFLTARVAYSNQPATTGGSPTSSLLGVQATLIAGERLSVVDITDPETSAVVTTDPGLDPLLTLDPLEQQAFFADEPELDTLSDLNLVNSLVGDVTGPPPPTGG